MGAVFFAKIGHTFTEAPITFSGAVCLQHDSYMPSSDKYPYLEFQIVHNKANYEGWEILGATMECIVVIDVPAGARFDYHVRGSELFALDFHKGNSSIVKQTYHKVSLEGSTHPYFKRVWHCRHILDENSPLLKKSIKEEIKNNSGWPSGRLSHNGIRNVLLPFNTLVSVQFCCCFWMNLDECRPVLSKLRSTITNKVFYYSHSASNYEWEEWQDINRCLC